VTAAYILRMVGTAFFGELNPRWGGLRDVQRTELVAGGLLVASILWMGVFPKPFTDRIRDGVESLPGIQTSVTATAKEHSRHLTPGARRRDAAVILTPPATSTADGWLWTPTGTRPPVLTREA